MSLHGKVAIVTGGNTGIGKSIVLALAAKGRTSSSTTSPNPQATEDLEKQVVALGDEAIGVEADVSKVDDLQTLVDAAVKAFGRLDIMVNNAGVETRTSILDTTEAAVREGARDQPEERVLRYAARREADDRPGWRRSDHQHHVGPRGLADAGQHPVLPLEGWHAHAHAHRRGRARTARHPRRRRRPRRGGHADQHHDDGRSRRR